MAERSRVRIKGDIGDTLAKLASAADMYLNTYVTALLQTALQHGMRPGRVYEVRDVTPVPQRQQGPLP